MFSLACHFDLPQLALYCLPAIGCRLTVPDVSHAVCTLASCPSRTCQDAVHALLDVVHEFASRHMAEADMCRVLADAAPALAELKAPDQGVYFVCFFVSVGAVDQDDSFRLEGTSRRLSTFLDSGISE